MNDTAEVDRLRARVAELEAELATSQLVSGPPPPRVRAHSPWRSALSALLVTIACLLAPLSVLAVWANTELSDTAAWVETVAPIADDPAVQSALADEVTAIVLENVGVDEFVSQLLSTVADQPNAPPRLATALPALAGPIVSGVESFTRDQVGNVIASDQFAQVWVQVNTVAHDQVVTFLEGTQGGALSAQDNTISLNLGPIVELVKERLLERGFTVAERIPPVDRSFVLVHSESIGQAQGFYRLLNALGIWLPVVALLVLALGVYLARDRRRALIRGSLGVVLALLALGVGLAIARTTYMGAAVVLSEEAAGGVFDTLVRFLRNSLRATAVAGLVVALIAFLSGPSTAAVRTRTTLEQGIGAMRGSAEAAGWQTGRFGTWMFAHRSALRVAIAIGAGLVLLFWTTPTVSVVVWTAVIALVLLAVVEFLGRPPVTSAPSDDVVALVDPTVPIPVTAGALASYGPDNDLPPASPDEGAATPDRPAAP